MADRNTGHRQVNSMTARTAWWSVPGMRTGRAAWTVLPARLTSTWSSRMIAGARRSGNRWLSGSEFECQDTGQVKPGQAGPRGVRAVQEPGREEVTERPVIPAGVEVTGHHLRLGARPAPAAGQVPLPGVTASPMGATGCTELTDRRPGCRVDARAGRGGRQARHRWQRDQRPAGPQPHARGAGTRVKVSEGEHAATPASSSRRTGSGSVPERRTRPPGAGAGCQHGRRVGQPPREFSVSTRTVTVAGRPGRGRRGRLGGHWPAIKVGSCQATRIAAGNASSTASHHRPPHPAPLLTAATATAASAGAWPPGPARPTADPGAVRARPAGPAAPAAPRRRGRGRGTRSPARA